ncbi:MAG: extracellular solute-binding protein [Promicromonosporaceae bacterium]|nr:extracellular solute-binding protein [Promicromonosporaceae bacterium]
MQTRKTLAILAVAALAVAGLTACGNGDDNGGGAETVDPTPDPNPDVAVDPDPDPDSDGSEGFTGDPVTLTWSGWDLARGTEFQDLTEAFNAQHDNITIELVDYPNAEWIVAMTADLAAGTAPDLITLRNITDAVTWGGAGQLHDVSDIVAGLDPDTAMRDVYVIGDGTWGVPFRADHWVLYYNIDMFEAAGVDLPDGTWTWDDYHDAAVALRDSGTLDTGVSPAYQHNWPSTVSAFAHVQTLPRVDLWSGDMNWLAPYYERALARDAERLQPNFGAVTTGSLHHLAEFGQQRVAMTYMGTWFMAQLIDPEQNVDDFRWGLAPVPQFDNSTTGLNNVPTTVGGPTGVGINVNLSGDELAAARVFLTWVVGPEGAMVLANRGQTAPLMTDAAMTALTSAPGMPNDELALFALGTRTVGLENLPDERSSILTQIFGDFHTEVMSGSTSIERGVENAERRFVEELG